MHVVFAGLMFIFVLIAAVVIVGAWVITLLFRTTSRVIRGPRQAATTQSSDRMVRCTDTACNEQNPEHAKFCRRCGKTLNVANARPWRAA